MLLRYGRLTSKQVVTPDDVSIKYIVVKIAVYKINLMKHNLHQWIDLFTLNKMVVLFLLYTTFEPNGISIKASNLQTFIATERDVAVYLILPANKTCYELFYHNRKKARDVYTCSGVASSRLYITNDSTRIRMQKIALN
uniref:Uncharacterized protein n=1 Tax=Heterorhabditis bacteriophora TaxID=37862 RepID=A0A1I7XBP3_HETBA